MWLFRCIERSIWKFHKATALVEVKATGGIKIREAHDNPRRRFERYLMFVAS